MHHFIVQLNQVVMNFRGPLTKNLPTRYLPRSRRARLLWVLAGLSALAVLLTPLSSPLFPARYSTVILGENDRILRVFLAEDQQWRLPPDSSLAIPEKLKDAVLTFEDRAFSYHPGFNPFALARAAYQNGRAGRVVSGASTITMQVARLARPKARTLANKAVELLQAIKIELLYSKSEILSLYLNHAPYGGNVVGYQAASLRYFQKLPASLTWSEAALLAVLPNAPGLLSPDRGREALRNKRDRLLEQLYREGYLDSLEHSLAVLEPLPVGGIPFRIQAPHLSRYLKQKSGNRGGIVSTTINPAHQENVEALLGQHIAFLQEQGIGNGAVLVAETQTGKIRAYAGSADFFDVTHQGQVDGIRAPRSSGSILKPFLYGLAFDEGLLLPETLIKDIPTFYGSFSPQNADEKFEGVISAREALTRSLNVPAVRLLYTYGQPGFYHFLQEAGVSTLFRAPSAYGLPLILGGAETTLYDMTALFAGLGKLGRFAPLQIYRDLPPGAGKQLISPYASYQVLDVLREVKRPGAEYYWHLFGDAHPIAWKTGTSYGQRDGWAIGVTPEWTIGVWIGNFDGEGNANLAGAKSAGPLLFDIFNYLPQKPGGNWFTAPDSAGRPVTICLESGFLAGESCPETDVVTGPAGMKALRRCPYHRTLHVDLQEKEQVCSLCWESGAHKEIRRLVYPPEIAQFLRERGRLLSPVPPHHPGCPNQPSEHLITILYPQQGSHLWVPRDFGGLRQKIVFRAAHQDRQSYLYWYLNDHYLGSTQYRHELAVSPEKGWQELQIVDNNGVRTRSRFFVDSR